MPTKTLQAPLVGSHFRPPAKLVLDSLSAGCQLILEPDPQNSYDPKAIKVSTRCKDIPESQYPRLEAELPAVGWDLDGLLRLGTNNSEARSMDELVEPLVWLGFIADSDGAVLAKARSAGRGLVGNREIAEAMLVPHQATLGFDPAGKALVVVSTDSSHD